MIATPGAVRDPSACARASTRLGERGTRLQLKEEGTDQVRRYWNDGFRLLAVQFWLDQCFHSVINLASGVLYLGSYL